VSPDAYPGPFRIQEEVLVKTIPFMKFRKHCAVLSLLLLVLCVAGIFARGLNYALDFTGGTQIEVFYSETPDLEQVRQALTAAGYPNHEVVFFGTDQDVLIRLQNADATGEVDSTELANEITAILSSSSGAEVELLSSGFVSSLVGDELKEQGGLGMLVALAMIMIYIALRFQFKFSVGAVASLAHDVIITFGFFALTQLDFDLTVLAAILAVIGYSLNDTIVVDDRIRENFRILRGLEAEEVIDISLTQTLTRTMITSLTTLFVLLALYFLGGQIVKGFSIALIVGIVIGTYSSIYVSASILMFMNITKEDLLPPVKDKEALDAIP
jgi:preprotein translocase subunit SecF